MPVAGEWRRLVVLVNNYAVMRYDVASAIMRPDPSLVVASYDLHEFKDGMRGVFSHGQHPTMLLLDHWNQHDADKEKHTAPGLLRQFLSVRPQTDAPLPAVMVFCGALENVKKDVSAEIRDELGFDVLDPIFVCGPRALIEAMQTTSQWHDPRLRLKTAELI